VASEFLLATVDPSVKLVDGSLQQLIVEIMVEKRLVEQLSSVISAGNFNGTQAKLLAILLNQSAKISSVYHKFAAFILSKPRLDQLLASTKSLESFQLVVDLPTLIRGLNGVADKMAILTADERLCVLCNLIGLSVSRCHGWPLDVLVRIIVLQIPAFNNISDSWPMFLCCNLCLPTRLIV
jgi:hypothetical protein